MNEPTLVYDLRTWTSEQRGELVARLAGAGIAHDWRGATNLVVSVALEARVDTVIGDLVGVAPDTEDGGTKRARTLSGATMASPAARLGGWLVDTFITGLMGLALVATSPGDGLALGEALAVVAIAAYHVGFVHSTGQTPGKHAARARVVVPGSDQPPGWMASSARFVVANVPVLAVLVLSSRGVPDSLVVGWMVIVYVWILFDGGRRGLHDRVAGTVVVRT